MGRFSRFAGGLRIGADFFERRGAALAAGPPPRGLVDAASELSAALPLPLGNLAGLLRMERIGEDERGRLAVALTSRAPSGGIWFATPLFALRLPLRETLSLWAPGTRCAPPDLDPSVVPGCVLVGRHEQRLLGALVVSHDYWFYPRRG